MPEDSNNGKCMYSATCCCYTACDCGNPVLLFKGAEDFLCFRSSCCIAVNSKDKGCGMTTDSSRGECCKIGLFCCDCGLISPTKLCACASQCLCCVNVASFPCSEEYVPECVCTMFCPGLQVAPKCGCCVPPPPCPALDKVLKDEPPAAEAMSR